MAVTYFLVPLHTRPDLIPTCIQMLKKERSHCNAELLSKLENRECSGMPCSLCLMERCEHIPNKDNVIGHVRCTPVTNRSNAVFVEGLCIDEAKRGRGLGKIFLARIEEFFGKLGYLEVHLHADEALKGFYLRQSYKLHKFLVHTVGANVLRSFNDVASWYGNTPSPGWEGEYDGPIATEAEVANGIVGVFFVKYLYEISG